MVIVGLTGSIGMGKSTAAGMLRQMGVPVYDADAAVHALQAPGGAALPAIEAAFPGVVKGGVLDRHALGAFLQRRRVLARPGMTDEKLAGILRQQVPDSVKRRRATIVVPTGLGLAPTRAALAKAVARLKKRRGRFWPANPWREKFTAQVARARRK